MIEKISLTDIDNNLHQISFEVASIRSDNFEENLKNVNMYIKQLEIKKNDLKGISSEHEYQNICDMVHMGVKQISSKLDSIIEKKMKEQQGICSELSKVGNTLI